LSRTRLKQEKNKGGHWCCFKGRQTLSGVTGLLCSIIF